MTKSKALEVILKQDKYFDCKVCLGECVVEEYNDLGVHRAICKQCKGAGKQRNPQYAKACSRLGLTMPPKYYELNALGLHNQRWAALKEVRKRTERRGR